MSHWILYAVLIAGPVHFIWVYARHIRRHGWLEEPGQGQVFCRCGHDSIAHRPVGACASCSRAAFRWRLRVRAHGCRE